MTPSLHLASRRPKFGAYRLLAKSTSTASGGPSPWPFLPNATRRGKPPQVHQRQLEVALPSAHCGPCICESTGIAGTAPRHGHCAQSLAFSFSLSFFLGVLSGPALLPPSSGWLGGGGHLPRASARGPAVGRGQFSLGFKFRSGCGGQPKIGPSQVRCLPFLCSTPERGLITAPPVPGTSYPIAGVWGARIWCSVPRGVCTALRPRALVRQDLQRPCIQLPAAGALIIALRS